MAETGGGPLPPYGTAMQEAIAKGDLAGMKQVAADAERYLAQAGDLRAALEYLKLEIAKHEHKSKK
jgi:Domain of unknown function (DUF1843)